jgi:Na+-driven multidrug efflux pump
MVINGSICLATCLFLMTCEDWVIGRFTTQATTIAGMHSVWPVLYLMVMLKPTEQVLAAVIRGTGQQGPASCITLGGHLLIGIPTSFCCAFPLNMGLTGLWLGTASSAFACSSAYSILIGNTDWPKLLLKVKARLAAKIKAKEDKKGTDDTDLDNTFTKVNAADDLNRT